MRLKEILNSLSEGKYSGPMEPLSKNGKEKKGAIQSLETALIRAKKNGTTMNYKNIDAIMQKIAKSHNITGQKIHDDFVKTHNLIPDNWIKKVDLEESSGHIPKDEEEAHDPRWANALTVDVSPGEDKKQASKWGFKVSNSGPPKLRTNGKA
jgi:hypothetical protein